MLEVVVGESQTPWLVAAQIRVDNVRTTHEILEHGATVGVPEIEREALLVAVERFEEERILTLAKRGDVPANVPERRWVLDLDHLRAEIGKLQRSPWAGAELLQRDNPDIGERQAHRFVRALRP